MISRRPLPWRSTRLSARCAGAPTRARRRGSTIFLVVASGGTAVVAGLLGSGDTDTARTAAALAIGAMVLLVGGVVFVRLVHYRVTGLEYNTALVALRTYLVSRAPEVGPYVVMPTLADDVRLRMSSRVRSW